MKLLLAITLTVAALATSCGDDSEASQSAPQPQQPEGQNPNTGSPNNNTGGTTQQPAQLSCDQQWTKYVKENPVGKFTLRHSWNTLGTGFLETKSEGEERSIVKTSSSEQVVFEVETKSTAPTFTQDQIVDRSEFMRLCKALAADPTLAPNIVERGEETITVPAGTYKTKWDVEDIIVQGTIKKKTWVATLPSGEELVVKRETRIIGTEIPSLTIEDLMATNRQ